MVTNPLSIPGYRYVPDAVAIWRRFPRCDANGALRQPFGAPKQAEQIMNSVKCTVHRKEYGPMNNDTLMLDTIAAPVGYVYILGPRGLDLPICKIGKTKNDPLTRCAQINDSSTGDILWDVKR
jgi:hypothetical protein